MRLPQSSLEDARAPARLIVALEHRHVVAARAEADGCGEAAEAASDHHGTSRSGRVGGLHRGLQDV